MAKIPKEPEWWSGEKNLLLPMDLRCAFHKNHLSPAPLFSFWNLWAQTVQFLSSAGPHKITFGAELSLGVYSIKYWTFVWTLGDFLLCFLSDREFHLLISRGCYPINQLWCRHTAPWSNREMSPKVSKFILKIIQVLQGKCRRALLAKKTWERSFGDHKIILFWLNQTRFL